MSVIVLFAHPAYQRSRANRALVEAVRGLAGVTFHDLYETYPDFMIDVEREQALIAAHDALVFQHPFYWYSAPAHMKEWLDLVLTHGFAYGLEGTAIKGKPWLNAVTAGGRPASYGAGGYNLYTIPELLRPFEATAHLCGCVWQNPFVVFASHLLDDAALAQCAEAYRDRIVALRDGVQPAAPSQAVPASEA